MVKYISIYISTLHHFSQQLQKGKRVTIEADNVSGEPKKKFVIY